MKRIIAFILWVFLMLISIRTPVLADNGDGNMDGGGGGMGSGTGSNFWNDGEDGVRVTVVRASDNKPVSTPI